MESMKIHSMMFTILNGFYSQTVTPNTVTLKMILCKSGSFQDSQQKGGKKQTLGVNKPGRESTLPSH